VLLSAVHQLSVLIGVVLAYNNFDSLSIIDETSRLPRSP